MAVDYSYKTRHPELVESELFGDPEARWLETMNMVMIGKNSLVINGCESKTSLVVETKEGRIVNRIDHGLSGRIE